MSKTRQIGMLAASLAGAMMLGASAFAAPVTLVSDNFDSAPEGVSALNGRSPDTGSSTWIARTGKGSNAIAGDVNTTFSGGDGYLTQTSIGGGKDNGTAWSVAEIAFTPGSYDIYSVEATLNFGTNANFRTQIGFSNGQENANLNGAAGELAVRITRGVSGAIELLIPKTGNAMVTGPTIKDVLGTFSTTTDYAIKLVYDSQANTASVYIDNTPVTGLIDIAIEKNGSAYTPSLQYGAVMWQVGDTDTDIRDTTWDNFKIQAEAIPEPASLSLLSLGGLLLLRRRK